MTTDNRHRLPGRELLISALLMLVTFAVYWPVRHYDFVNHDDPLYVYENPHVLRGLSQQGVAWAFGRLTGEHTYWHPVTWLSLMLDSQLFGTRPGSFHLVNVLFHAANAALLFLVLKRMTGACWRSAVVAGLFAWHPLQVDSVAWIAERKNVLSTFFWLLTMWAYVRYVEKAEGRRQKAESRATQHATRNTQHAWPYYAFTLACFALGLMTKPMLVTVPVILLLLDVWPLRRLQFSTPATPALQRSSTPILRLFLEKVPLFMLAAASAVITVVGHRHLGSLAAEGILPLTARLANAVVSYARYLWKAIWPVDLAVHYPHPGSWALGWVLGASAILIGISVLAAWAWRRRPYLLAGWLWFLVTLLPTIGIIQASSQAMADRFAYVPLIGVFIMLVWLAADLWPPMPGRGVAQAITTVGVLAACLAGTRLQLRYWRDGEALFRRAVSVTTGNYLAEYSLGCALGEKNKLDEARVHFAAALKIWPGYAEAHDNLGVVFQMQGKPAAAEAEFRTALRLKPNLVLCRNNLGLALQAQGKIAEAIAEFRQVLRVHPDNPEARNNLGKTLAEQGKLTEAVAEFAEAARLKPEYVDAQYNLGNTLLLLGKPADAIVPFAAALQARPDFAEAHYQLAVILAGRKQTADAITHFRQAAQLKPDWLEALNNLAWILATQPDANLRNGTEAVRLAAHAVELTKTNNPGALDTLAAAYAEAGRFPEAAVAAQKAVQLAEAAGQKEMAAAIQQRRQAYDAGRPYREEADTAPR